MHRITRRLLVAAAAILVVSTLGCQSVVTQKIRTPGSETPELGLKVGGEFLVLGLKEHCCESFSSSSCRLKTTPFCPPERPLPIWMNSEREPGGLGQ